MTNLPTPADPESADLARRMLSAVTTSQAGQSELAALPPAETEESQSEYAEALDRLRAQHTRAVAQLAHDLQQQRETIAAESERARRELEYSLSSRLTEIHSDYSRQLAVIDATLHDQLWLTASITDADGEHGPRGQCERLRAQIQQSGDQLARLAEQSSLDYERLRVTMERRRGQLGELPSPERIPTSREELANFALQQFGVFRQSSVEIEQLVIPKALVGWRPLWISLVLWSGAASVIWG
ncbi:MAG: hypothetical protein ACKOJF_27660, partial [Planctomycetaceae bacterium]